MSVGHSAKPVCAITGASSGVGLATAIKFASTGYRIAICARNQRRLADAARRIAEFLSPAEVLSINADVGDMAQATSFVNQTLQHHGRIDVLVNNAGTAPLSPLIDFSDEDFRAAMQVNVAAVFATTRAVWPIMQRQLGGTIINISLMAAVDPFPGFSVYGATKAWVELFTKAIAAEGCDDGICAVALRLGAVETPMLRGLFPDFPKPQTLETEEVAKRILELATRPSSYTAGEPVSLTR